MTEPDALFILSIVMAGLTTMAVVAERGPARRLLDRLVRRVRGW